MFSNYLNSPLRTIYFDKPSDKGGESSENDDPPNKTIEIDGEHILPEDILKKFYNTAEKHGGMDEFAETLYNENKKLRDKLRDADSNTLQEGQVAVPKKVQEDYEKIKELGGIDEVVEKVEGYEDAVSEKNSLQRDIVNKDVAGIYGYNPEVLGDLTSEQEIEVKETDVEGEDSPQKRAFIQTEDGEAELSEWLTENKKPYMPALKDSENGSRKRVTPQDSGSGNETSGGSSAVKRIKEKYKKEAEKGNPLTAN